jgi:phage-related protein
VKSSVAIVISLAALALGACGGDSKEDKAKAQVCDARADISKQVESLKVLTPSTATLSQIQGSLKAIGDDLTNIKNAQGDLTDQRKSQVEKANQAFGSQLQSIRSTLGATTSLSDAKAQLTQGLQDLASTYQDTLSKVDCS